MSGSSTGVTSWSGNAAPLAGGAGAGPWSVSGLAAWLVARAGGLFAQEARGRRLFLWLPVFFGAGIVVYFAAEREPPVWPAALGGAGFGALAWRAWAQERVVAARVYVALAFLFAGFSCAALRTLAVAAPALERTTNAKVTAFVEAIDLRPSGARLLLRVGTIEGLAPERTPVRVRVNMRGPPGFESGATIVAPMRLMPPPRASEPSGYDFSRDAFFQQIGAVGNLVSRPQIAPDMEAPLRARLIAWIDRGRNTLTERIAGVIGGANGAVAAALVTGKRGLIPETTNDALRAAGIYHVVSISGLHMVLAAGLFMWSVRSALALAPGLALRYPIKKWAAGFAMLGATAYDLFSGSEVATERSLVMMLVLLGAVVFDRPAISMRNLAIAALFVMAREPSTVLGPSFQMSFAAVAAMTAAFERRPYRTPDEGRREDREAPPGAFDRLRLVFGVMIVTTLVASLATDPFATFHFHRISVYGLIGNSLTLPLVEFVVMPAAVLGVAASLFGLDAGVWWVMGHGVGFMMYVAERVAVWPGAVQMVPAFGVGALLTMTMGLLWLTLWQTPLRWLGIAFALAGVGLATQAQRPDVITDARGQTLAWRGADGRLSVLNARGNPFAVSQWLGGDADTRSPRDASLIGDGRCDALGCVARLPDGRTIALLLNRQALAEDCRRADVVVTPLFVRSLCKGPALVMDGAHFERHGATHLHAGPGETLRRRSVREADMDRPWSRAPKPDLRAPDPDDDAMERDELAPDLRD
ncbi:MAG: ComEC/Rec2-related protein [Hyphomicrobiales bacterium]|nr:ComEC/Rec2-related protein [Hyphomicrobiales bacterium]